MLMRAWIAAFVVTVVTVPIAIIRYLAIGAGGFDPTRTMRITAHVAAGVAAAAALTFLALSLALIF